MRTAIYTSGLLIADALSKGTNHFSDGSIGFLAGLFVLFLVMDIIEFLNKLIKR